MSEVQRMSPKARGQLARLLDERSARDAMAAYYALRHPADRLNLCAYYPTNSGVSGFLAIARTGLDLFRPLAIPFVAQQAALTALLRVGLEPGRPVVLHLPLEQRGWAEETVDLSDVRVSELLRLDLRQFEPIVNVLVVESRTPVGWPRYEIRSGKVLRVAAGLNWKGSAFAEVYLEVEPAMRGQGYAESVLAAIAGRLLAESVVALYRVEDEDPFARMEAEQLGFRSTGIRTLTAQAVLREEPKAEEQGRQH
jgi:GNAT superfamily N-acetyltransferase